MKKISIIATSYKDVAESQRSGTLSKGVCFANTYHLQFLSRERSMPFCWLGWHPTSTRMLRMLQTEALDMAVVRAMRERTAWLSSSKPMILRGSDA